jgi:hypothetical protein
VVALMAGLPPRAWALGALRRFLVYLPGTATSLNFRRDVPSTHYGEYGAAYAMGQTTKKTRRAKSVGKRKCNPKGTKEEAKKSVCHECH